MREIKFRGKSTSSYEGEAIVNEGDWVYGDLIVDGENAYIVHGVVECNNEYIALEEWCPVDIKTVGQDTGLKDRHGVEIYEGDILASAERPDIWQAQVYYEFGAFRIKDPHNRVGGQYNMYGLLYDVVGDEGNDYEVIGNIYSNPELLGGTDG